MSKVYCWSCMKQIGTHQGNELYKLGDCCRDNSYPHLESNYPQPVQMEMF